MTLQTGLLNDDSQACVLSRRDFIARAALGAGSVAIAMGTISALPTSAAGASSRDVHAHAMTAGMSSTNMHAMDHSNSAFVDQDTARANAGVVEMDGEFYKHVALPAKANATPQLNNEQLIELERGLACPCPCTLDVYTCRTTMMSCGNSPAVHRDVQDMVRGGHSADEIMQAMIGVYGNVILMAPPKKGANLIAWFLPFAAIGTAGVLLNAMLHRWRKNANDAAVPVMGDVASRRPDSGATDDEMARLRAALRDDNR